MRITDLSSRLDPKSIDPTIIISANLTFEGGSVLPIRIDADLWLGSCDSARRICAVTPLMPENLVHNESFRLVFQTQQPRDQTWLAEFRASFSQRHLDLIETTRALQAKGDVFFTVNFGVQYLEHGLSSRALAARETPVAEVPDQTKFLQLKFWTWNTWFKISGSDWIHEYSPALGLGKFMVVEIPGPSSVAQAAFHRALGRLRSASGFAWLHDQLVDPRRRLINRKRTEEEQLLAVQGLAAESSARSLRVLEEAAEATKSAAIAAACKAAASRVRQHLARRGAAR